MQNALAHAHHTHTHTHPHPLAHTHTGRNPSKITFFLLLKMAPTIKFHDRKQHKHISKQYYININSLN